MILSRKAILTAIKKGQLQIVPFNEAQVEAAHIDLHLEKTVVLPPKGFALGNTKEKLALSDKLCGLIEGRAKLAKLGVSVEQSSTFMEPGSKGKMTLEFFNAGDETAKLIANQPIAKMYLVKVVDKI